MAYKSVVTAYLRRSFLIHSVSGAYEWRIYCFYGVSWRVTAYELRTNYAPCAAAALPLRRCCVVEYFAALHEYLLRQHDDRRQKTYILLFFFFHSFQSWTCLRLRLLLDLGNDS